MNIFVLDLDPERAARMLCDQHVGKMLIESVQLLSTAYPEAQAPAGRALSQYNNGYARWARSSFGSWMWLFWHAMSLSKQWWEWRSLTHVVVGKLQGFHHGVAPRLHWMKQNPPRELPILFGTLAFTYHDSADPTGFYRTYYAAKVEAWRVKGKQVTWDRPGASA